MSDQDEQRMICICCGERKSVLIQVECTGDSFLTARRGVCQACIKSDKNIEEVTKQYELDRAELALKQAEGHVQMYKKELEKLRK